MTLAATLRSGLACAVLLVLTGCAGTGIRGQPPFVTVNNLRMTEPDIELDLGFRNVNSIALDLTGISFSMLVDRNLLVSYNAASQVSISANGTENLRFEMPADEPGLAALRSLATGEIQSLAYIVEGEISAQEESRLKFRREGFLYPVPGRPGQFR